MAEKFADLLGGEYKREVLKLLKDNPGDFFSINEIAEKTSGSNPSVKKFLEELSDLGLVKFRKKAGSYLIEYNPHSRYDDAVREMLKGDISDLWEKGVLFAIGLFENSTHKEEIESIVLFGSVARGTADSNSDIDILVLIKDGKDKEKVKSKALDLAKKHSGEETEIVPVVETVSEFERNLKSKDRFESGVIRDGKALRGKELEDLFYE
ncbi:MAG: nucleotidyltransferase domain-containing protein [Nanohaloarchaea archaeon]|nr:nucleotidyltransferase domain-containing protein [Candidatus Nanohaloarchaea archaeon]